MCPDSERAGGTQLPSNGWLSGWATGASLAVMVCGCSLVTQVHSDGRTTAREAGRTDSRFVCSFSVKSAVGGLCHQVLPSLAQLDCCQPRLSVCLSDCRTVCPSVRLPVCPVCLLVCMPRLAVSSSMLTNKSDDNKLKGSDCCDWPGNIKGMPPLLCARHVTVFLSLSLRSLTHLLD